jgi:hypothetical protein
MECTVGGTSAFTMPQSPLRVTLRGRKGFLFFF